MSSEPTSEGDEDLPIVVDSLIKKFPDIPEKVIAEVVTEAHAPLAGAPIQEYVPVLVEHQAQVQLNELEHDRRAGEQPESEND